MELIGYMALVALGLLLGSFGMGGSMLAIPILVYVFSLNMVTASAYALFIIGTTSLAGFGLKQRDNLTDMRAAVLFGIPSLVASFVARKWIVVSIPNVISIGQHRHLMKDDLLLFTFSLLMVASAILMIVRKEATDNPSERSKCLLLFPAGMIVGFVSGLVGAGGGFLVLPSLVVLGRLPLAVAVGTTLIIISLNSLVGFCGDMLNHSIEWSFLLVVTGFCLSGLFIGYFAKKNLSSIVNQRSFGWILAAIAMTIITVEIIC